MTFLLPLLSNEEWLSFISSGSKPDKICFSTIPNVIPPELRRATIMYEFLEILMTKMEAPFEQLLNQLGQPLTLIMAYTFLPWPVRVGNRKNISVASFWPMSAATVGPAILFSKFEDSSYTRITHGGIDYLRCVDDQTSKSVLYISMGSFLSFFSAQKDEIAGGLHDSAVRCWVACGETSRLKEVCRDKGLVVPWCDQLRVFPFLTHPISADQRPTNKLIVEDWKVSWTLEKEYRVENLVRREEIGGLLQNFMDLESNEGREKRKRVKQFQEICQTSNLQRWII
ncbi:unnamed protein product [Dovyalis caffra]|uniref:Uncharacterized protein n=1 Tax=Dovyalis caffra TaxID=77055 RepID=A0AAV1RB81_9ROSI|nr:unnamed protein product [Dovyalis caffra]